METNTWLTLNELAMRLELSRTNLYRTVQQGKILASKIEFQWRFNRKKINDWVTSQRASAVASQGGEHGNELKES